MIKTTLDLFREPNPPRVIQVVPTEDFKVYAYFDDGTIHLVDMLPFIKLGTVFEPLQDPDFFRIRATVLNRTLAWDMTGDYDETKCVDLAPEFVYDAPVVDDPLEEMEESTLATVCL